MPEAVLELNKSWCSRLLVSLPGAGKMLLPENAATEVVIIATFSRSGRPSR
jgi:hypothetical protein